MFLRAGRICCRWRLMGVIYDEGVLKVILLIANLKSIRLTYWLIPRMDFVNLKKCQMKLPAFYFFFLLTLPLSIPAQETAPDTSSQQHPAFARFRNSHPDLNLPSDWSPFNASRQRQKTEQRAYAPVADRFQQNPVFIPGMINRNDWRYSENKPLKQTSSCQKLANTSAKIIGASIWLLGGSCTDQSQFYDY